MDSGSIQFKMNGCPYFFVHNERKVVLFGFYRRHNILRVVSDGTGRSFITRWETTLRRWSLLVHYHYIIVQFITVRFNAIYTTTVQWRLDDERDLNSKSWSKQQSVPLKLKQREGSEWRSRPISVRRNQRGERGIETVEEISVIVVPLVCDRPLPVCLPVSFSKRTSGVWMKLPTSGPSLGPGLGTTINNTSVPSFS